MPFPAPFPPIIPRRFFNPAGVLSGLFLLTALCLPAAMAGPATAPDETPVVVIGLSPVFRGNTAAARLNAVADGMSRAVDQAAFAMIETKALSRDFSRYQSLVTGHTNDFVDSYQVLAEGAFDKVYRVMMRVSVSRETLGSRLFPVFPQKTAAADAAPPDAAGPADRKPQVLFLMSEQSLSDVDPRFWWGSLSDDGGVRTESAMTAPLVKAGMEIITHDRITPDMPLKSAIIFQPDLDNALALDIGRVMKADAVVAGKAIVYKMPGNADESETSYNATVTARLLDVGTGRKLGDTLETAVTKDTDDAGADTALDLAAGRAAETLAAAAGALNAAGDAASQDGGAGDENPGRVYLEITGVRQLGNYIRFRRFLTEQKGVNGLTTESLRGDEARLLAGWNQGAGALAALLKQARFSFFTLVIDTVETDRIVLSLSPLTAPSEN